MSIEPNKMFNQKILARIHKNYESKFICKNDKYNFVVWLSRVNRDVLRESRSQTNSVASERLSR